MMNLVNAADAYSSARRAVTPSGNGGEPALKAAAEGFEQAMAQADQAAVGAMTGKTETHNLIQSIAEAQIALETVVAMRDRVVEAYQEILRMPV